MALSPVASSIEPPTSPTPPARRIVSAAAAGASPKPFSRSAETGRSVAAAIARQWASASSRVTAPSRLPSTPACAPLEVASAGNQGAEARGLVALAGGHGLSPRQHSEGRHGFAGGAPSVGRGVRGGIAPSLEETWGPYRGPHYYQHARA